MASLVLKKLVKNYGDTQVLKGVELEVEDGEYLVIVGPSGCGKSTLLRCVAGLEEISSGDLLMGGRRVNEVSARDRDLAMVFQSYALYPHMTVRDNLGFALKIRKTARDQIAVAVERAAAILALTGLLDRFPFQLSGGQRQRVAMGRAVVREPSLFLFDEPLSNLDASLRSHMRLELKRLHRRLGATILHVTHDQVEALTLATRILVLDQGVVQQVGTPQELFQTPVNSFVAAFIGSPSMNLLPAIGRGEVSGIEGVEGDLELSRLGAFTLGIRPHDVLLSPSGLPAVVDVVESLGAEALVHLNLGPHHVVARIAEPVTVKSGDSVRVRPAQVHCFDRETGRRL